MGCCSRGVQQQGWVQRRYVQQWGCSSGGAAVGAAAGGVVVAVGVSAARSGTLLGDLELLLARVATGNVMSLDF